MVRLQSHRDGEFASSHLSIFPCKSLEEAAEKGPNSHSLRLVPSSGYSL